MESFFVDYQIDKERGQYLAFDENLRLLAQGNDPKRVSDSAKLQGCKEPFCVITSSFEEKTCVY